MAKKTAAFSAMLSNISVYCIYFIHPNIRNLSVFLVQSSLDSVVYGRLSLCWRIVHLSYLYQLMVVLLRNIFLLPRPHCIHISTILIHQLFSLGFFHILSMDHTYNEEKNKNKFQWFKFMLRLQQPTFERDWVVDTEVVTSFLFFNFPATT